MSTQVESNVGRAGAAPQPMPAGEKSRSEMFLVKLFPVVPEPALAAAVPLAWG